MEAMIDFFLRNLGVTKEQQVLIIRTIWVLLVTGHMLWTWGALAFLGIAPPFAVAQDLKDVVKTLNQDRLERTEQLILTTKRDYCKATNEDARRLYADHLQELIDRAESISGKAPFVPRCDEV